VLLDVLLPDVDGFEVLLKIRQHPSLRTMPVVMLTAKATRDAVLRGLAGGADGYITKPFEIEALIKAVKVVLGLSDGGGTTGSHQDPWPG
jgi:two-component system OmpR family response regulator